MKGKNIKKVIEIIGLSTILLSNLLMFVNCGKEFILISGLFLLTNSFCFHAIWYLYMIGLLTFLIGFIIPLPERNIKHIEVTYITCLAIIVFSSTLLLFLLKQFLTLLPFIIIIFFTIIKSIQTITKIQKSLNKQ